MDESFGRHLHLGSGQKLPAFSILPGTLLLAFMHVATRAPAFTTSCSTYLPQATVLRWSLGLGVRGQEVAQFTHLHENLDRVFVTKILSIFLNYFRKDLGPQKYSVPRH